MPKKAIKDDESVFTDGEVEKVADVIREDQSLLNYGILLAFQTGVRIGELCTLKYSDIQGNKLCIRRTEIRYRDKMVNMYLKSVNPLKQKLEIGI